MTSSGPVVVDTDVYSRVVVAKQATGDYARFPASLQGRAIVLAAQTVAELRAGAIMANWGPKRTAALESAIKRAAVLPVDDDLTKVWAQLKASCKASGHALGDKIHDGDRWIASTAVHLGLPLATNDGIYRNVAGLTLL